MVNIHQIDRAASAFQQPVDEQVLQTTLECELSGENIIDITELEAGLFNNTYRVSTSQHRYILKVAPDSGADTFYSERHLMRRERAISRELQSLSPLIPEYLSFFTVDGRDAFLQPLIAGRLWHDVITSLSEDENAALWIQLGEFARCLHSCDGERFGYPAPSQGFRRWSAFIVDNVDGMIEDCRRLGVHCEEIETYRSVLPHFSRTLDEVASPKLLHGDLWPRNVIIDGAGTDIHIKAVFDAERAFWGDPLSDWVLILYGVPDAFWQGYGEDLTVTGDPVRIAVYKGMYFILNILEATRSQQSDGAPREWLSAINAELKQYMSSQR